MDGSPFNSVQMGHPVTHLRELSHLDHPAGDCGLVPDAREEAPRAGVEEEHKRQVRLPADGGVGARPRLRRESPLLVSGISSYVKLCFDTDFEFAAKFQVFTALYSEILPQTVTKSYSRFMK